MRVILIIIGLVLSANTFAAEAEDLKSFFDKNKIGHSADYGIFKNDKDYIISVHGFDKDLKVCLEIAEMLNKDQPNIYSCKPLND